VGGVVRDGKKVNAACLKFLKKATIVFLFKDAPQRAFFYNKMNVTGGAGSGITCRYFKGVITGLRPVIKMFFVLFFMSFVDRSAAKYTG
jgi:hypothetical protein